MTVYYDVRYKERPCPGCGKIERRPPQELCYNCRRLIELGREYERKLQDDTDIIYIAVDREYTYYPPGGGSSAFLNVNDSELIDALCTLGQLDTKTRFHSGEVEYRHIFFTRKGYKQYPYIRARTTVDQADALETVLTHIGLVMHHYWELGFRYGRNIMHHLAESGVKELNNISIRG